MKRRGNNQVFEQDCDKKLQSRKYWKEEEDNKLHAAVFKHGSNWKLIAEFVPGRNASQCAQRWKRIKPKENERNQKWTEEEDKEVLRLTKIYQFNWKQIANEIPNRTGRQIRERYVNHLDSNIIKTPWTKQEDKKIWEMYQKMGTRWSDMSKKMPGRPENMIKNRFYSFIRKQYGKVQNPYYIVPSKVRILDEEGLKQSQGMKKIRKFKKIQQSFKMEEQLDEMPKNINQENKQQQKQPEQQSQSIPFTQFQTQQSQQQQQQIQFSQSQFPSLQHSQIQQSQFPQIIDPFSFFQDSIRSDSYRINQYPEALKQFQDFQNWLKESLMSSSDPEINRMYKFETPMMSFLYMNPSLIHSIQQQPIVMKEEENEKLFGGIETSLPVQIRPDIFEEMKRTNTEQQHQQQQIINHHQKQ
ncbi:unnamed protein product [Paramecium primaurelia]|uniref:Uncharacterized protein n=1 Tax=Paramecium primaurelia TaxID=5886 RepID=A0A8S1MD18_PARPR|nr:unnamed protein product [Paramecium primaurelia]